MGHLECLCSLDVVFLVFFATILVMLLGSKGSLIFRLRNMDAH